MSDQNSIKDWKAYFAALPEGKSHDYSRYPKLIQPRVVWAIGEIYPLESVDVDIEESHKLFERAQEIWEANDKPDMWIFVEVGGAPWFCPAAPKPKQKKK